MCIYSVDGFEFEFINDGSEVTITGSIGSEGAVTMPGTIAGEPVTSIGVRAFAYCDSLRNTIVDPSNPSYASMDGVLYNRSMTELIAFPGGRGGSFTMQDGVLRIGDNAFCSCAFLTHMTIPETVTSIGDEAFSSCLSLISTTFEGYAPTVGSDWTWGYGGSLTVYYYEGSSGFTTPTWHGVHSVCLSVPDTPSDLVADSSPGLVLLSWTAPFDGNSTITHYSVYRDGALLVNVSGTGYDDMAVVDGYAYTYDVRAVNYVGESATSDDVMGFTVPAAPSELQVEVGPGWNNVSWTMPIDGGSSVTHFNVSTETSVEVMALEVLNHVGDRWYHKITDIVPGTQCNYTVSAMNAVGWSDVSNSAMGTSVPAAPCDLAADAVDASVTLTWSAPANGGSNITSYNVYRNGTYIGNVTGTSYVDGTVDACTWYSYSVIALNAVGKGPSSTIDVLVPDETSPTVVDHSPTGGDVPKDESIVIEFSEAMDEDSVTVTCGFVTLNQTWDDNVITLTHDAFEANNTYAVVVNGDDTHGNAMDEFTWTFTTEDVVIVNVTITCIVSNDDGPVVNATVTLDPGESTATDADGRYTLTTTPGEHTITVSKDDFDTVTENITVTGSSMQTFDEILDLTMSSSMLWVCVIAALIVVAAITSVVVETARAPATGPGNIIHGNDSNRNDCEKVRIGSDVSSPSDCPISGFVGRIEPLMRRPDGNPAASKERYATSQVVDRFEMGSKLNDSSEDPRGRRS